MKQHFTRLFLHVGGWKAFIQVLGERNHCYCPGFGLSNEQRGGR